MTVEELTARCRKRDIVECRQVTAWYLKDHYGWSSGKIGLLLGIDRTTVIYSVDKVLGMIEIGDPMIIELIELIRYGD